MQIFKLTLKNEATFLYSVIEEQTDIHCYSECTARRHPHPTTYRQGGIQFDSVYRHGLWLKLLNLGVRGKMLRIIKSIYMSVKSCVRHCKTYSDFFEVSIGLRQGEVMSPILFSLFVEDLELFLQRSVDCGLTVYGITLILLLFADDMVILGSSQQDLQNSLNLLYEYCQKWGLTVNTDKTKVLIFRKRGRVDNRLVFTYNDNQLDIVDNFNYLGVVFNYTGTFY